MPLFPMILISITTVVVMIAIAMKRSNFVAGTLSVIGLNACLVCCAIQLLGGNPDSILHGLYELFTPSQGLIAPLFAVDSFAQFNMVIILISSLACFTLCMVTLRLWRQQRRIVFANALSQHWARCLWYALIT